MRTFGASLLHAPAALLAPSDCRLCGAPLLRASTTPVCHACLQRLAQLTPPLGCELCGEPLEPDSIAGAAFSSNSEAARCMRCLAKPPGFICAVSAGSYGDLRAAVHLLKFEGVRTLAAPLGDLLAQALLRLRPDAPSPMLMLPVPLFRGKRRFNQSTLLAARALHTVHSLAPDWQLSLRTDLLVRTRRTESQFLLTLTQRRRNVRGAFAMLQPVRGLHILLVDDVYTTGATVAECTAVLLRAGAASVRVATLARAAREVATRWQPSSLDATCNPTTDPSNTVPAAALPH